MVIKCVMWFHADTAYVGCILADSNTRDSPNRAWVNRVLINPRNRKILETKFTYKYQRVLWRYEKESFTSPMLKTMDLNTTYDDVSVPLQSAGILHYVLLSSATLVTAICLCIIKFSLYSYLERGWNDQEGTRPEKADVFYRYTATDMLSWYYSDLCCDALIFITLACMSLYSLHFTSLLKKPFTGEEAFHSCEIPLCFALGILSYRLIRLLLGSEIKPRFRTRHIYIGIAIVTYISILVTSENTIVGVVGMFCQMPILFHTAEKITLELHIANTYNGRSPRRCASGIHAVSVVIFSLILPLVYLTLAVKAESPYHTSYFSLVILMFSVPYFGLSITFDLIHHIIVSTCIDDTLIRTVTEHSRLIMPDIERMPKTLIQSNISNEKRDHLHYVAVI